MRVILAMLLLGFVMMHGPRVVHATGTEPYKPDAGPYRVEVLDETWRDDTRSADPAKVEPGDGATTAEEIRVSIAKSIRGRKVPIRAYIPVPKSEKPVKSDDGKGGGRSVGSASAPPRVLNFPVVIFSHGLGGSREMYEYIAQRLASHGYLVVLPQHIGSDTEAMREAAKKNLLGKGNKDADAGDQDDHGGAADGEGAKRFGIRNRLVASITEEGTSDPANLQNRPRDISFVLDQIAKHERLSRVADLNRVAVAGHSFGSYTTMAVCGMRVDIPAVTSGEAAKEDVSFRDERVKCGIAMSPQGRGVMGVNTGAWDAINVPMLIATGTKDMGQGERAASWRHEPYAAMKSADTYFLNITDANHMTFSGRSLRDRRANGLDSHLSIVKQTCTAFLDAYLRDAEDAKKWLKEKAVLEVSGGGCEFEHKLGG